MVFKDKLKEKRVEAGLSQVELAAKVGVSSRTIQNYELGQRRPANIEIVQKLAEALNTTTEVLLGSSGMYVMDAKEKGGAKSARDIEDLVGEVTGLFAGGKLNDDALDGAVLAGAQASGNGVDGRDHRRPADVDPRRTHAGRGLRHRARRHDDRGHPHRAPAQ